MNKSSPLPVIFMFAGQGSQYYQMGRALYDKDQTFRCYLDELDRYASRAHNFSCVETLYNDAQSATDEFCNVVQTHPSIFMIQLAMARTVMAAGVTPEYVLGASLGESCALSLAGCLSAEETLSLVIEQAQHVDRTCNRAAMLTVLADSTLYETHAFLYSQSQLAALNFPGHFTVSGGLEAIEDIEHELQRRKIDHQRLNVSHAFHSELMDPAKTPILTRLSQLKLKRPRIRVISCAAAGELEQIAGPHLWNAAREPIRFQETVSKLEASGDYHYVDFSPSGTLATFTKYCLSKKSMSAISRTLTPYGNALRNVEQLMQRLPESTLDTSPQHSNA